MKGWNVRLVLSRWIIGFVIALLLGCGPRAYTDLTNAELQALLDQGMVLVDIRLPEEWRQSGVIKGSVPLTFLDKSGRVVNTFFSQLDNLASKDQPLILVCRSGNRTSAAAQMLTADRGYTQVYHLQDGISGWLRAGLPLEPLQAVGHLSTGG